jgi:hypothetical protein
MKKEDLIQDILGICAKRGYTSDDVESINRLCRIRVETCWCFDHQEFDEDTIIVEVLEKLKDEEMEEEVSG